jgi:hypothetical protein
MSNEQNTVNDDQGGTTNTSEGQSSTVITSTGNPASTSSIGTSQGTQASPGNSGTDGTYVLPGRRTYNPLSKLASYNYVLTLYQLSPAAYSSFVETGRSKIDALQQALPLNENTINTRAAAFVIAQSGGINNTTQTRAPGFELDYFIESFEYDVTTTAVGPEVPAFIGSGKMTIVEQYGFSFISNLKRSLDTLKAGTKDTAYDDNNNNNMLNQFFVLGIKFYGYDINGNIVKGDTVIDGDVLDPTNQTENLFESFYDIYLTELKFKLTGKSVTYNLMFGSPSGQSLLGIKRGRIIDSLSCVGSTVEDMLKDLTGKLNKKQLDQSSSNPASRKIPNKYEIEYLGDAKQLIAGAKVVLPNDLNKFRYPGSNAQNTANVNDRVSVIATPDSNARQLQFKYDTGIVQAINMIVQNSTFMTDAMQTVYSSVAEPDGKLKSLDQITNNQPRLFKWFNVSAQITGPIEWDNVTKDWAYTTKILISTYDVATINSPLVTNFSNYYGPHKYYNYWLTGLNSEVLDYTLNFNNAYFNTIMGTITNAANVTPPPGTNNGTTPSQPGIKSGGTTAGSIGQGGEAQASVVTALTDPTAYVTGKITILGDPDFLVKDQTTTASAVYRKFYEKNDLTISANGGQVFVELILKEGVDYNHKTGLLEVNESIQFFPYPEHIKRVAKGIIYLVLQVKAKFSGGKFTMDLTVAGALAWGKSNSEVFDPSGNRQVGVDNTQNTTPTASGNATEGSQGTLRDRPLIDSQPMVTTSGNITIGEGTQGIDDDTFASVTTRQALALNIGNPSDERQREG